jgi:mannosyltransferase
MALALYTHNWGLFLGLGTAAAFGALWWRSDDRPALLRDGLGAYGVVALAYLPWVPTLLFQARHTAAPWSDRPGVSQLWGTLSSVLGGAAPAMAFTLTGLVGVVAILQQPAIRARARRVLGPEATAVWVLLVMLGAAILAAWLASQPSPAWAMRYFAAFLGPLLLLGGVGLARAGWMGVLGIVLVTIFWLDPRTGALDHKSNAHHAVVEVKDRLYPGDLVVAAHPEYGPTLHIYLPPGLRWANTLGPVRDPTVMDWRDALARLKAAHPTATSDPMVRSLRQGQRLLLVMPILRSASWKAPWTKLVRRRALQWERRLDRDTRLVRTLAVPRLRGHALPRGVRMVLYERVPDGTGGVDAVTRPEPRGQR